MLSLVCKMHRSLYIISNLPCGFIKAHLIGKILGWQYLNSLLFNSSNEKGPTFADL